MSEASLSRGLNALREQIDAPVASFFSSCVHCGMCAEACLFYTETGDPKYTPIYKLRPLKKMWFQEFTLLGRILSMFGLTKKITHEELAEWEPLVYDSCTMCGKCSMTCPVGNDLTMMIRKMREGFVASGHAPEGLRGAAERAVKVGSPMGLKPAALHAQLKHIHDDMHKDIPIDVEDADYMVVLSSMEVINFPEFLVALYNIFKKAGVSWTLSSHVFEATNTGIQIGSSDIARQLVSRIVEGAEILKVKNVISPECGHAYQALRYDGPSLIGRPYPFKVVHILELLDDLRAQGKIKFKSKDVRKITYHDPCQITRRGGVVEQPRNLLNDVSNNFVDMREHGIRNWCCGGGGGVSSNERADEIRTIAFKKKKEQLDEINPDLLVTACANCRIMIEEGLEEYNMDIPVTGLSELLDEHLEN